MKKRNKTICELQKQGQARHCLSSIVRMTAGDWPKTTALSTASAIYEEKCQAAMQGPQLTMPFPV